jgi:hypothetical protein
MRFIAFVIMLSLSLISAAEATNLPLKSVFKGRTFTSFDTEGMGEGLLYLGSGLFQGAPSLYVLNQKNNQIHRYTKSGSKFLTEIKNREVVGFGTLDNGQFLLLTNYRRSQYKIERFNTKGDRISHIDMRINLDNDELHQLDLDDEHYVIQGPSSGYKVHKWGGQAVKFSGFPIAGSNEYFDFEFNENNILDISFMPSERKQGLRIPFVKNIDNVSFFKNSGSHLLYFLIETEVDLQTSTSSFYIYKANRKDLYATKGVAVTLPYNNRSERHFWFDDKGNIYVTTIKGRSYQVWWMTNF